MKTSDSVMKLYYKKRASVYEKVYCYPERQQDLRFLESYISKQFENLSVLEVAAGTGYWSRYIARASDRILATDATVEALLQINRNDEDLPIDTKLIDAFELDLLEEKFNAAFAGLWISHVPRQRLNQFLKGLHCCLEMGAKVIFIDNSLLQCQRFAICDKDNFGNTFQDRALDDGSIHRLLKNFPTEEELIEVVSPFGENCQFKQLENYWLFQYQSK